MVEHESWKRRSLCQVRNKMEAHGLRRLAVLMLSKAVPEDVSQSERLQHLCREFRRVLQSEMSTMEEPQAERPSVVAHWGWAKSW